MNEQQHNMTGAWALNALDADERARTEEYLAQDPVAADEAHSFEETAGELASSLEPVAPRRELKSSLMAQIAQTRQLPPLPAEDADEHGAGDRDRASRTATHRRDDDSMADPSAAGALSDGNTSAGTGHDATVIPLDRYRSSVRRSRWLAVAAAVLMVTTIAGLGLWGTERAAQQEDRATIEAMESARAGAEEEREMVSTLLAADDTAKLTIPAKTGGNLHLMYSKEQEAMIIQAADLPVLPSGSVYQLWLIDDSPHDAGLITKPDETVLKSGPMPVEASIGLTVEPVGGSEQPTSDVIAIGEL